MMRLRARIRKYRDFLLAGFLLAGFFLFYYFYGATLGLGIGQAAAADLKIRGKAFWHQNGYIYFNCLDDVFGDRFGVEGNLYLYPEPLGFHFYVEPCVSFTHGVYLDEDNNFYGDAWNPTRGIISFNSSTTPPDDYDFNSACEHTCNASNDCLACYVEADQKIYGWARVLSSGEWIKFNGQGGTAPTTSTPPVIQSCDEDNPAVPGVSIQPGFFAGSASSSQAEVSLNCATEMGGETCGTRAYNVRIGDLAICSLSAPNWNYSQACDSTAKAAVLRWQKRSGIQTAYEIVVNDVNTLSTSTAVCWSGKKYSDIASQYLIPNSDPDCGDLNYNTNYYWWIRLFDENDVPTEWMQYNSNTAGDTDGNPDNSPLTFTTFKHEFPNPFYSWSPLEILVGTTTDFSSNSSYFTSSQPSTPQTCGGYNCSYVWSTSDPLAIIQATTSPITGIIFYQATNTFVTLQVTDADNYSCSSSTALRANYDLPLWREIKAE